METLRLVNSYGDVAYGVASQQPLQRQSGQKGLTEGSGAQGAGRAAGSTSAGSGRTGRTPGTYGPAINTGRTAPTTGRTAPTTSSTGRTPAGKSAQALTPTESARIATARKELAKMAGWSGTAVASGISYKVTKTFSGKPVLAVQAKGERVFRTIVDADTRAWLAVAEAAIAAYRAKSVFRPSAGRGAPVAPASTPGTPSETPSGTTSDTSGSSGGASGGASSGTSTPSWFTKPYLNEMLAASGWKGPSFNMPGVTLEVKTITLDGVSAPAIVVSTSSGRDTLTAVEVTPAMAEWAGYAANVIPSKAEDDQRKASGTPAPSTSGGGSSARVTSETTSGDYSIWASDSVPSSDSSAPATKAPGSGGSSMRVVEDAPAGGGFAPSGEASTAPEAVTLVSGDAVTAEGEEGFFAKNKWYIAGGTAALLGGYAYMHRMNPTKYPLPEYLSKFVRR